MINRFKQVSEWVAKAGDTYMDENIDSGLTMGIIDKLLRKQGIQADAVSLEIIRKNIKVIIMVPDDMALPIEIISGNKEGDVYSSFSESFEKLSEKRFFEILNMEFSIPRNLKKDPDLAELK